MATTLAGGAAALASCETFDPPPKASIAGAQGTFLEGSPGDPLVLRFDEAFQKKSLRFKVVRGDKALDIDPEGNLPDEDGYCVAQRDRGQCSGEAPAPCCKNEGLVQLASYDGATGKAEGASVEVAEQAVTIRFDDSPKIAVPYLVVVESGLEGLEGNTTLVRQRLEFTYRAFLPGPSSLPTGPYFFLFDIAPPPLQQQLRLYAWLNVDAQQGTWEGLFTDGNRTTALNDRPGCPADCAPNACQLFPAPACVKPSTNMGSIDEFQDFIPIKDRPVGYTFLGAGYTADLPDGTTGIGTPPFPIDIVIGSGNGVRITAVDTVIIGQISQDNSGRWRGSGSATIAKVQVNSIGEEPTTGTLSFMSLFPEEAAEVESYGEPIYKPGEVDPTAE
ncbi:MAG: hypothetical protein KC766_16520 [Myxococcales bacterium]|nr:hypothetical protein [Myxococcales bacterium]